VTDEDWELTSLYDSEAFVVVHVKWPGRYGFEIADKRTQETVFLVDGAAHAFSQQINAWQANTPEQDDVEAALVRFTMMGRTPLVVH
jgi:hypothetical protein